MKKGAICDEKIHDWLFFCFGNTPFIQGLSVTGTGSQQKPSLSLPTGSFLVQ